MAEMAPGLRRQDEEGDAVVNLLNALEHQTLSLSKSRETTVLVSQ